MARKKSPKKRRSMRHEARFPVLVMMAFILLIISITSLPLLQQPGGEFIVSQGISQETIQIPAASGGIYYSVLRDKVSYVDFGQEVVSADTEAIATLATNAQNGEYLAYELDGYYRADVLVRDDAITIKLNLDRGLHEINVYVPRKGFVVVERHMAAAV